MWPIRSRTSTPEAIRLLHDAGVRIVMLTGDSEATARVVAGELGIDEVEAGVLPADKGRRDRASASGGAHGGDGRRRH